MQGFNSPFTAGRRSVITDILVMCQVLSGGFHMLKQIKEFSPAKRSVFTCVPLFNACPALKIMKVARNA